MRLLLDQLSLPELFLSPVGPVILPRLPSLWQRWEPRGIAELSCRPETRCQDPEEGRLASGKGRVGFARAFHTLLGSPPTAAGWAHGPCLWLHELGDPRLPRASRGSHPTIRQFAATEKRNRGG